MSIKEIIRTNLKNIPGRYIKNKCVAIECDDWGSIRMPSKEVHTELLKSGLRIPNDRFINDTIETSEDLEMLFNVLYSVIDSSGHHPVVTAVSNMANPDFEKIRQSGFSGYHYEKFTDTYIRYGRGENIFGLWKQGIAEGLFIPELHGREHLSVQIWLRMLKEGNRDLLVAFDKEFVSPEIPGIDPLANGFRAEFYHNSQSEIPFLKRSITDSVELFRDIFGFSPKIFVPGNAVFHPVFEEDVTRSGIKFLYVNRNMFYRDTGGNMIRKNYLSGQKNTSGLIFYLRNCVFEPCSENYSGIDYTLMQIDAAFRWGKPAIISTHRVNFAGGIDVANREKGLRELKDLLNTIVKRWPDVEFMSSLKVLEKYCN